MSIRRPASGIAVRLTISTSLLLVSVSAFAADALHVLRSQGQTVRISATGPSGELASGAAIRPGESLATRENSYLTVGLEGGGQFTLGTHTMVRVYSSEAADPPGRAGLLRMQLALGVLRINASAADKNPPADVRVNLGPLKLRVFGADVWLQALPSADEVCLLGGAVEILAPSGPARIDQAGECLRYIAGKLQRLSVAQVGSLAPRIARTAYDDDFSAQFHAEEALIARVAKPMLDEGPVPPSNDDDMRIASERARRMPDTTLRTVAEASTAGPPQPPRKPPPMVAATSLPSPAATPRQAPVAKPSPSAAQAAAPSASKVSPSAASGAGTWRIVLASLPDRSRAEHYAAAWRRDGLAPEVLPATVGNHVTHRVVTGRYSTHEAATRRLALIRRASAFKQAWIVHTVP